MGISLPHGSIIILMCLWKLSRASFQIQTKPDGSYAVQVDGNIWMESAPVYFYSKGEKFSTDDGSLSLSSKAEPSSGHDTFGLWESMSYGFTSKKVEDFHARCVVKKYNNATAVVFSQHFSSGIKSGASLGSMDKISSSFPSFKVDDKIQLGYLNYAGLMTGFLKLKMGRWQSGMEKIVDGVEGGPLLLFDGQGNVIVLSAFSQFMTHSYYHDNKTNTVSFGLMGSVDQVPPHHTMDTILYYSQNGVNKAMEEWGALMRTWYGKDSHYRYEDPSVKYLGYYTDNGAYYYHNTEGRMNYEDTILSYYKYSKQQGIPYRYFQLDDWWYFVEGKGYGATVKWEAMPSVFPHGMRHIFNTTGLPVVAHNRYWSPKTSYAKQNGGNFDFIINKNSYGLPVDQRFWDYLFSEAIQWGLMVYEQDFLNSQVEHIPQLTQDLFLGTKWLKQMGEAASRHGLRIQYCMSLLRHILQSLEIQAVTQTRVSNDYLAQTKVVDTNMFVGISSMLADAVGLAPFKDNLWTSSKQPGNPYNLSEPNPEREVVIALLSTGPVAPGDRIGYTNTQLIKRTCAKDGTLLKPSKPATSIDAQIYQRALGLDGPVGEVWTTYSDIDGLRFGIIFAMKLTQPYSIGPSSAGFGKQFSESLSFKFNSTKPVVFSDIKQLLLDGCDGDSFCLHYTFPLIRVGGTTIGLIGEIDKIVPVSPNRVSGISVGDRNIVVTLRGSEGEELDFYLYINSNIKPLHCVIGPSGQTTMDVLKKKCF